VSFPSLVDLMKGAKPFEIKLKFSLNGEASRFGLLIQGPNGWGEFAPFANHSATHQARWLQATIEMGWGNIPEPNKSSIPVNAIVPALPTSEVKDLVLSVGAKTIKVKFTASALAANLSILQNISEVIDKPKFRIDFNQKINPELVDDYLTALKDFDIEYLEEPSAESEIIKKIKEHYPIAIDETIRLQRDACDLKWVDSNSWADYWILKPIPLGGFNRTSQIVQQANRPVVISGSFDSSVGLYLTTLSASWLSDLPAGAATGALLQTDVISSPIAPAKGEITVKKITPETTVEPEMARIGKLFRQLENAYFELLQLEGQ
jgi:o-succinylbenzoate synthase